MIFYVFLFFIKKKFLFISCFRHCKLLIYYKCNHCPQARTPSPSHVTPHHPHEPLSHPVLPHPECSRLGCSEEKEWEGREEPDDDAIEHCPPV
jgi:hypothetical protein